MNNKKLRISQSFQRGLLVLVMIAFLATTAFLWLLQGSLSRQSAIKLMELYIRDVRSEITYESDRNLLTLAHQIAWELEESSKISNDTLKIMANRYDVTDINIVDENGYICASTYPDFVGYDMGSGQQSSEFLVLLEGENEYIQNYRPLSYDESIYRKYGGVAMEDGGFVQVGYGAERFQRDIDKYVVGITTNRHVGKDGGIIIVDENWRIVSDRNGSEGLSLDVTGVTIDLSQTGQLKNFDATVYGQLCYCMYELTEGYLIFAYMPQREAALSRNVSVGVTTGMQILVFTALFIMIFVLVKRQVVNNIYQINDSLSAISAGELNTVVDVRSHVEFDELSNDINATVDTLKRYIADAAARIDAELAFARAIQHSALPSVFPPYPNRSEFDIWACMYTAKEVGGDFYDFYFVDEDTLVFLVADVSGKGIPAAMFMMQSKTLLKSYAESGMSVEQVFTEANNTLCEGNEAGMFVTAWMGCLNVKTGQLIFANAGHNPPLIRRADGSFEYLKTRPGLVLAGMNDIRYRKNELQLNPGDRLYLYTDGVTEATDINNQLYGEERLLRVLNDVALSSGTQALCEAVKRDVDGFAGEAEQFDDITMLSITYNGSQEASL